MEDFGCVKHSDYVTETPLCNWQDTYHKGAVLTHIDKSIYSPFDYGEPYIIEDVQVVNGETIITLDGIELLKEKVEIFFTKQTKRVL